MRDMAKLSLGGYLAENIRSNAVYIKLSDEIEVPNNNNKVEWEHKQFLLLNFYNWYLLSRLLPINCDQTNSMGTGN